jgi:diguanylate cyclase (GGDEF)-like protein
MSSLPNTPVLPREEAVNGFFTNRSLHAQLILLGLVGVSLGAVAAVVTIASPTLPTAEQTIWRLVLSLALAGIVGVGFWAITARRVLRPLYHLRDEYERSQTVLAHRTLTVDRLLEFSQTIQGAGKPEQIFQTLCHFLRTELGLSGIAIIAHEPESLPSIQIKSVWPDDLMTTTEPTLMELDNALCPCLRQNLPRIFKPEGSPVRCGIDRAIRLPATHPAYCIPFTVGRKMQCVVHMLMPIGQDWTEQLKQLAQTYVNTAYSSLMSLNLLEDAEQRSMTDPLTQLYNRRSMEQLLQREVALAERHGHSLSIVMIDMDKFKEINDSHGHAAGDHMLKAFADCVRMTLRRTDLAFRYGGDEFIIALPQTPIAQAQQVVNKLRQAFAAVDFSSAIAHLKHQPTLSIGVAERSKNGNILTLPSLLSAADQALYEAKNSTRNCVKIYEPPRAA